MADQTPSKTAVIQPEKTEDLPKLTPAEFRVYNKMAEGMDRYHNHFRQTWNMIYAACEANKRPAGMSIRQFMSVADRLIQSLTMHHTIEEEHIFPVLAKKMPAFKKELELLTQHKHIHEGLDKLEDYLRDCRQGETEFRMSEMKNIMDTFGKVLWEHLDDEVHQLGADKMRRCWTLDEMRRMPM
ncbi:hypothetical protein DM02DRAFT_521405 [Periconia macrospinosa]|uniref:Hemerythrin-like domain-containing protein n=1 Tax=Periconia macrospinosa TaxID=97972 RepID=A0A2V1DXS6_9PLEO|nr:hypothetical protein DM02DRAFT_521405 [Periconia macrospinosa]